MLFREYLLTLHLLLDSASIMYPERNEKKFSKHLEVSIRRITFAPAFEREGRQLT